jgi:hypothetical protein
MIGIDFSEGLFKLHDAPFKRRAGEHLRIVVSMCRQLQMIRIDTTSISTLMVNNPSVYGMTECSGDNMTVH